MAHAAGAALADLELCQFHPTALAAPGTGFDGLLVTEAVRGEGATLLGADGERFTDELAPRDEVTLAVLDRMKRDGTDHVLLDMRQLSEARFPSVFEALREAGFDPATEPIPVAPASHYVMGGIATDLEGRSSLPGSVRGRRVRLHRAARREPARLELADRVLRARSASGSRLHRRSRTPAPPPEPPDLALRPAPRRDPRGRLEARRPAAERRAASSSSSRRPLSARAADRALRARAGGVAGLPSRLEFPRANPELDGRHIVCSGDELAWQAWA